MLVSQVKDILVAILKKMELWEKQHKKCNQMILSTC